MNALQLAYAAALAQVETLRAEVKAACPMPLTDDNAIFDAWIDASTAMEERIGLFTAERLLAEAEDALVRWSFTVAKSAATGADLSAVEHLGARWPKLPMASRRKLVDLALRLGAA